MVFVYKSSISHSAVEVCYVEDVTCYTTCECDEGYAYSAYCNIPDGQVTVKAGQRETTLEGLMKLMGIEDVNIATVTGWINTMNDVTQASYELSSSSRDMILSMTNTLLTSQEISTGASNDTLQNLISALENANQAYLL